MVSSTGIPRTRERKLSDVHRVNRYGFRYNWPNEVRYAYCDFVSREKTIDTINPWIEYQQMRRKALSRNSLGWYADKGLHWDVGGEFTSTKYAYEDSGEFYSATLGGSLQRFFEGQIYPRCKTADSNNLTHRTNYWREPSLTSLSDLDKFGATAISRVAPVNPHSNVLQGLVELRREGLPSLPGYQSLKNRDMGKQRASDEYLNYQFGVLPLVNEIKATAQAMRKSEELLRQYVRDSGRPVRRRYQLPEEIETQTISLGTVYPEGGVSAYFVSPSSAPLYVIETTKIKRWFSGTFVYHADDRMLGVLGEQMRKAEYLYGLKPDVSDIYNLTPWSWLIDWFTNTGDVVNNLKMFTSDGLVMTRGYVMEKISKTSTFWLQGMSFMGQPMKTTQTFSFERKIRRRANPFGFGLLEEDLSPRQVAILAALGITQSGRWQG